MGDAVNIKKALIVLSMILFVLGLPGCVAVPAVSPTASSIIRLPSEQPTTIQDTPTSEPFRVTPTLTLQPLPEPGAVNTADSLDELRRLDRVQPIIQPSVRQGELELSNGTYGFTIPWALNSYLVSGLRVRGDGRIPLASIFQRPLTLEMHVTPIGQILVVGFVSEDELRQLTAPGRRRPLTIVLYTQPYQQANQPLSLAANLILRARSDQVSAQVDRVTLVVGGMGSERVLVADSVLQIRKLNQVKPLPARQNPGGYDLEEGFYGFTALWAVEQIHGFDLQVIGLGRPPINNVPKDEMQLELHHTSEGELYLVGFISEDDLQHAKDVTRQGLVSVMMLTYPSPAYSKAVAISVELIQSARNLQGVPGKPAASIELLLRGYVPPVD